MSIDMESYKYHDKEFDMEISPFCDEFNKVAEVDTETHIDS